MQLSRVGSLALIATLMTSGCAGYTHHGYAHHASTRGGGGDALALGIGILAGAAIVAASERPYREPEVVVEQRVYYVTTGPAVVSPPSPRDRVPAGGDDLPGFDPASVRATLGAVDVTSCRSKGAAPAYGHATVTVNPDGVISKVIIDEPGGLPADAVQCIGDRLGAVTTAPFRGSRVTVGTVFRH